MKIEVEVDTLEQLDEALGLGVDVVLLDNMPVETLREAVAMAKGRAITEASGGITPADRRRRSRRPVWTCCRWGGSRTARRLWTWRWMWGRGARYWLDSCRRGGACPIRFTEGFFS